MKKAFPYLEKDGQHFPIVEVELQHKSKKLRVNALVDSGASFSVFRSEIAEYLGVKVERGKKIYLTGIGGRILGYLHNLNVAVESKKFRVKIIFSPEFNVSFNLVGRDNFFTPFFITFIEKAKQLIIED